MRALIVFLLLFLAGPGVAPGATVEAGIADVMSMVGRLPHADFATALQACDVFISVPSVDATAVSLLEAMAAARPVLATRVGSLDEMVVDGETGILVEPRSPKQLAAAIERLLADSDLRRQYGTAARRRCERPGPAPPSAGPRPAPRDSRSRARRRSPHRCGPPATAEGFP